MRGDRERPSATATFVACCLLLVARDPRCAGLVDARAQDHARACLAAGGRAARRWWRWCAGAGFRRAVHRLERWTLPGIARHVALRKRLIASLARRAIGDGARQLVVVAAGLDGLATTVAATAPAVRCFEIDHPATQAAKRAVRGASPGPTLIACDLEATPLDRALAAAPGYAPSEPTLFVVEGFAMYLDQARVDALLREIAASAARATVVLTWLEARADGRRAFACSGPLVDGWLRWHGEPFRSTSDRAGVAAAFAAAGFALTAIVDDRDLHRAHGLAFRAPGTGESIAVAHRGSP